MTQKEFEERTKWLVKAEDFHIINNLYMAAGNMDKDEFCKEFRDMQANGKIELRKSLREIGLRVGSMEAENHTLKKAMKQRNDDLADILIGKAHAHNDTDLYREAIKLVGQWQTVKRTIEMGLPLWDEDKEYICAVLDEQGKKIVE